MRNFDLQFYNIYSRMYAYILMFVTTGYNGQPRLALKKRNYAFLKILTWPMMLYIPNEQPLFCFDVLRLLLKAY